MDDGNYGRAMVADFYKGLGCCLLIGLACAVLSVIVEAALGVKVLP